MKKVITSIDSQLRNLRKMKGMNLQDVADKAGVTSMYISEIERNKKVPSDDLIRKLAEIYNVDVKSLFKSFGRLPEEMVNTLTKDDSQLFNVIYEISNGELDEEKRELLIKHFCDFYKELKEGK